MDLEEVKLYRDYVGEGLKLFPPFKGFGMKHIEFALEKPEIYKRLFSRDLSAIDWDSLVPVVSCSLDVNEGEARWVIENMVYYAHGIAMLEMEAPLMTAQEIGSKLGALCRGLLMQLKAAEDERTRILPGEVAPSGSIEEYIKGKRNVIIGYGMEREMYQIRLDAILYFEAVGERVFAYTKNNVYEIRHRLYQIERALLERGFKRASKAVLVNLCKIAKFSSAEGSRGRLQMVNGEILIASRSYYRSIIEGLETIL